MLTVPHPTQASGNTPPPLADEAALFLDFDGTLAEIAPAPDAVCITPPMLDALAAVSRRLEGRLALLSGRPLSFLQALVPIPGLAMAGVHGLERLHPDGTVDAPAPHPGLQEARAALGQLVARQPRLVLEDKGLSIGLHYRNAPSLRAEATEIVLGLARSHGLAVQTGKMVLELRTPGADKGDALAAFMAQPPFAGHSPIFIGDDDTDEAAFRAAAELGGHGIRVGGPTPGSAAAYHLPDVQAVGSWLGGA